MKKYLPKPIYSILRYFLRGYFYQSILTKIRLHKVEKYVKNIKTTCLLIGPYRNLSTLTGAAFHLHPNCQVLNHTGKRILRKERYNFIKNPTKGTLNNFYRFAVAASQEGKRGDFGGSITLAHAFEKDVLSKKHKSRYGSRMLKEDIRTILWKESHRVSNQLKLIDQEVFFNMLPEVKCILPIRNPIDTAISNISTSHYQFFPQLTSKPKNSIDVCTALEAVIKELKDGIELCINYPDNGFYFFQFDMDTDLLTKLASFSGLSNDYQWMNDVLDVWQTPLAKYEYNKEVINYYKELIEYYFSDMPIIHNKFMYFISCIK